VDTAGTVRRYESVLVRRSYRDGKKVRHETLANLSKLPADAIDAIEATLKGQRLVPAQEAFTITRSLAARSCRGGEAMAHRLGLPALLDRHASRGSGVPLIVSRVVRPKSKLSTCRGGPHHLGVDMDVAGASTDEVYAAMDWLTAAKTASRNAWPPDIWRRKPIVADGAVRSDLGVGDRPVL